MVRSIVDDVAGLVILGDAWRARCWDRLVSGVVWGASWAGCGGV